MDKQTRDRWEEYLAATDPVYHLVDQHLKPRDGLAGCTLARTIEREFQSAYCRSINAGKGPTLLAFPEKD
jgi:hypothetical protein